MTGYRPRGRTWWAHSEFTRINITPSILRKQFEDTRAVGFNLRLRLGSSQFRESSRVDERQLLE